MVERTMADGDVWSEWLRTETSLSHLDLVDKTQQSTAFGGLVQQTDEMDTCARWYTARKLIGKFWKRWRRWMHHPPLECVACFVV
jgi:hypothetical protein